MEFLADLWNYVWHVPVAGFVFATIVWAILAMTIETPDFLPVLRGSVIAQVFGCLPLLTGLEINSAVGIAFAMMGSMLFVWIVARRGDLSVLHAVYGVCMTYFIMTAVVACAP